MRNPYIAADGFTYEAEAMQGWIDNGHDTSPMTNLKLPNCELIPNHALRTAIQEWLQWQPQQSLWLFHTEQQNSISPPKNCRGLHSLLAICLAEVFIYDPPCCVLISGIRYAWCKYVCFLEKWKKGKLQPPIELHKEVVDLVWLITFLCNFIAFFSTYTNDSFVSLLNIPCMHLADHFILPTFFGLVSEIAWQFI